MILDGEALNVMAGCISRGEHLTVETNGVFECGVWCDTCGAPNATTFELRGITTAAVYDLGTVTACTVCIVPLCQCGHNVLDHEDGPCEECECKGFHGEQNGQ